MEIIVEHLENISLTRISILIIYGMLFGLKLAGIEASYLWFMTLGVCLSFIGLIIQKISVLKA